MDSFKLEVNQNQFSAVALSGTPLGEVYNTPVAP